MGTVDGVPRPTIRAQELRREATPAERLLWRELSASKLGYKFSRQMPVGRYICDFLCRSERLAVELDGYSHDLTVDSDEARDRFIGRQGIRVLRFANNDVLSNLEGVVTAIRAALVEPPTPDPSRQREGGRRA